MNRQLDLSGCMVEGSYVLKRCGTFCSRNRFWNRIKVEQFENRNLLSHHLRERCVDFEKGIAQAAMPFFLLNLYYAFACAVVIDLASGALARFV